MNQPDEETRREIIRLGKERYERDVRVLSIEGKPLMGMLLLRGYELRFVSGIGEVVTLRKPRPRRTFRRGASGDAAE